MIKACIIGVSGYGHVHYHLLLDAQAEGKAEIRGAAIMNQEDEPQKCARLKKIGCRIFDDYRVMLNELSGSADFCMIPTGTPLHRPMTIEALESGMHVLVEKPAAGCIEDAHAMRDTALKAKRMVAVGYQYMYAPYAMETKKHILRGIIGKVESIKALAMWPRDHAYYNRNNWAGRLVAGDLTVNDSPFNNAFAHDLMMMLFLAGAKQYDAALPVAVEAELYRANPIESADTACMRIETAENIDILFYATHASRQSFAPEIHILGANGSIVMTHQGSVIKPDSGKMVEIRNKKDLRKTMMNSVLDAVRGGSSFICDLQTASRQTMVVSAIHQSCTINRIPGKTTTPSPGSTMTFIPGIEKSMKKAFNSSQLLREIEAPWANPHISQNSSGQRS